MKKNIVIATTNPNKLKELTFIKNYTMLKDWGLIPVVGLDPDFHVDETGDTIEANTLLKLQAAAQLTDYPVVAEDSGIFVNALNGMPGVYSARFALLCGDKTAINNELLLEKMKGVKDRRAEFKCCSGFVINDVTVQMHLGIVKGTIATEERGFNGFAYDTLFIPDGFTKTFAEMSPEEKNGMSHRTLSFARTFTSLSVYLEMMPQTII